MSVWAPPLAIKQFLRPGVASRLANIAFRLLERPPPGDSRLLCGPECVQPSESSDFRKARLLTYAVCKITYAPCLSGPC